MADQRFSSPPPASGAAPQASFLYRPEVRQYIYQGLLLVGLIALFYTIINNTITNMARLGIASGFGFWNRSAGFDIGQTLIPYSAASSYGEAFWVGVWNTVLIAIIGIFFATILGFVIGIARLSTNWLVARMATVYVEVLRNIPLLLQLIFWYFALVNFWPQAREAKPFLGGAYLSNRGLTLPEPVPGVGFMGRLGIPGWHPRDRRHQHVGEASAPADGAAISGVPDRPGPHLGFADHRFLRHGPADLARLSGEGALQSDRRLRRFIGIHRSAARPLALYRQFHR